MGAQYPPKNILGGIKRVVVTFEVPTNADILPLTGWTLQVEDALRQAGIEVAPRDGSTVDAHVKVWLSVIHACTINDHIRVYSYVCQIQVYSNHYANASDLVIAYNMTTHGASTGEPLIPRVEKVLMDTVKPVVSALRK